MDRCVTVGAVLCAIIWLCLPHQSAASNSQCPFEGMVPVKVNGSAVVCIDMYEAAIEVYRNSSGVWELHPFNLVLRASDIPRAVVPAPGQYPHAYLSGDQARAACTNAGKRLCTHDEFLSACEGPQQWTYPYGSVFEEGACNTGNDNPVITLYGPNATFSQREMNDPRLDTLPNTLAGAGAFTKCRSVWGAFDLAGNLDEWLEEVDASTGHGRFAGGYFVDDVINGEGCTYLTTAHVPTWHDYSLGTRCCCDAA